MADRVKTLHIGVLSDTHLPHRLLQLPSWVVELFADATVDLILHAGDVDDPRSLEPLGRVAPVIAVQGNAHLIDFSRGGAELPEHVELALCGRRLVVIHGHRPGPVGFLGRVIDFVAHRLGLLSRERINQRTAQQLGHRFPWADIVVFGHTHKPFQAWIDGIFFFNPGAVSKDNDELPSVGLLTLGCEVLEAQIMPRPLE
jgi:putative phosphoesterase